MTALLPFLPLMFVFAAVSGTYSISERKRKVPTP